MLRLEEFVHNGYYIKKGLNNGNPFQAKLQDVENFIDENICLSLVPIKLTDNWLSKLKLNLDSWFKDNSYKVIKDADFGYTLKIRNVNHNKEIEFGYFSYVHELQRVLLSIGFDYT